MSPAACRLVIALFAVLAALIGIEWYSDVRLQHDLERADAQQQWASKEYEKSKPGED